MWYGFHLYVSKIPGVINVVPKADDSIEFESAPGEDTRAQVARAVVQAGFDLLELQPATINLEEIFLQLTSDEGSISGGEEISEAETSVEER